MKTLLLAIAIGTEVLMSACSHKNEVWVATKSTPVYASDSDAEDRVLFTLAAGDSCIPLREGVVVKAYLHTEIQCKNGRGWVIDKQNFDIKSAD
ncbi:hypothetical protein WN982_35615 [Paraburkholderia sp. IMGN_8]|uniref:hypothetical protein n=1 Tax=Paraburkholderia sp. IMGN_8 TaxID=3136564 RepID=UPI00310160EE